MRVVLVATRNSLNIGAAARAMSNFGILDLRVVRPYEPAFREARSAVGAAEVLANAKVCDSVAAAVSECRLVVGTSGKLDRGARHPLHTLETAGQRLRAALGESEVALLFGSEKFGLSNDDLSHCDWLLHIPTREEHLSMNLGQAVAVCLYELIRGGDTPAATEQQVRETAQAEDRERLVALLLEALATSGYMEKHSRTNLRAHLRRLVARLRPDTQDAQEIMGMLRQLVWKMRKVEDSGE